MGAMMQANNDAISARGFVLQEHPRIICASLGGSWLLERATPSWRIKDPIRGFQRIVREVRARQIALTVLDQRRTFPNAVILATDVDEIEQVSGQVIIPSDARFLVIDGQHRLWAQRFSGFHAMYACVIHLGLTERDMAELFLEINDNQKRVPSSLRWDLVRLVQPESDPAAIAAAEAVYLLATEDGSPFFQRIDLTGEQVEIQIKQGSLAPEFKRLFSRRSPLHPYSFEQQYGVILEYSIAISQIDSDRWGRPESAFFKARVLRALFQLLGDIAKIEPFEQLKAWYFIEYLERIDEDSLDPESIRAQQGSAGIRAIYLQLREQVLTP